MPQLPTAPYFVFNRKQHWIELTETAETRMAVNRLTLLSNWDQHCVVYDVDGVAWTFRFDRPASGFSILARLAAHIAYNPRHDVGIVWERIGPYSLSEVKDAYLDAVDHDDDILTQFVEPEALSERVRGCQTFRDLVETWRWMGTEHCLDEESD